MGEVFGEILEKNCLIFNQSIIYLKKSTNKTFNRKMKRIRRRINYLHREYNTISKPI